jgi:hypothetical protein
MPFSIRPFRRFPVFNGEAKPMSRIILIALLVILNGCARSSGVLKLGPDTYTVQAHASLARGGEAGARNIALTEANEYCTSQGKEIFVTNTRSGASTYGPGGDVEVMFRCLAMNDPELKRPNLQPVPNTVIEDRRR